MKSILLRTLLLLLVSVPTYTLAQDKIILVNGKKINCKILNETPDSVNIILHSARGDQNTAIQRKYIYSILYNGKKAKDGEKTLENRFQISAGVGYNFPLGDFGNHDIKNTSGYAKEAVSFDFGLSYRFTEFFGVGIKGFTTSNPIDTLGPLDLLGSIDYEWNINSAKWKTSGALAGLVVFVPGEVGFQFRALAGPMFINSPELLYTAGYSWIKQKSVSATAIGFDFGLSFETTIYKNLYGMVNIDYLFSKFKLENIEVQSNLNNQYDSFIGQTGEQKFSMFNFGIGLNYKF
jgi:hypothetical protein